MSYLFTTAQRFLDDLAARRSLACLDLPCPPQLNEDEIKARYFSGFMVHQIYTRTSPEFVEGATIVRFLDGSEVARYDGKWQPVRDAL